MSYERDNCLERSKNTTKTFSNLPLSGLRFECEPSWMGGRNIAQSTNSDKSSTYVHTCSVNRRLSVHRVSLLLLKISVVYSGNKQMHDVLSLWKKAVRVQLVKNFPNKYGTRMSVIVITTAFYWHLSWRRWIRSTAPFPYTHFNIVVPSTLALPRGYLHAFLLKCMPISWLPMRNTFSVRFILLHFTTLILYGGEHNFLKLLIMKFSSNLQSPPAS